MYHSNVVTMSVLNVETLSIYRSDIVGDTFLRHGTLMVLDGPEGFS